MATEEVTLDVGLDNMIVVYFDEKRCESCVKHMKKSGYIPDECDCLVKETTKRIDSLKRILYDYDSEVKLGKGFIHKTAILLFKENYLQEIFIYFSLSVVKWELSCVILEETCALGCHN